jgi:MFS family permease
MDVAPAFCGTACGMMNTGSALAAIVSPVVSGYLIDRFHSWELPFLLDMLLMAVGLALTFSMRPDRPFTPGHANGMGAQQAA